MAKPHCDKHKRYVPYCDDCKATVAAAEEAELQAERDALAESPEAEEEDARQGQAVLEDALREEESNTLKEGVGFPGAEKQPADPEGPLPEGGPGPDAEPISDPWADGKTPAEGQDVGDWLPPDERVVTRADIDETEAAMAEAGEFDIPPQPGYVGPPGEPPMNSEVRAELAVIIEALESGEPVTLLVGEGAEESLRNEGRREIVKRVRDYYADSIDTGAFQLLAYLEEACK